MILQFFKINSDCVQSELAIVMAVQMEMCFFVPLYLKLCISSYVSRIVRQRGTFPLSHKEPSPVRHAAPFCVENNNFQPRSTLNYLNPFYDQNGQFLPKNAVLAFFIGLCQPRDRIANNKHLDVIFSCGCSKTIVKAYFRGSDPEKLMVHPLFCTHSPAMLKMTRRFLNFVIYFT